MCNTDAFISYLFRAIHWSCWEDEIIEEWSQKEFHEFLQQSEQTGLSFDCITTPVSLALSDRCDKNAVCAPGCCANHVAVDGLYADALNVLVNLHKVRWNDDPAAVRRVYRTGIRIVSYWVRYYRGNLRKRG